MDKVLPAIPDKRYFTIGEMSELCGVKPYVLRYWEQEFSQLKPMKRRGNRRYYQHHEVILIRRIRELLYEEGFTISGARNRLSEALSRHADDDGALSANGGFDATKFAREPTAEALSQEPAESVAALAQTSAVISVRLTAAPSLAAMRDELLSIRHLLTPST